MNFPSSLRQSLTLYFLVVAILPILLVGAFSYEYFKSKHLETFYGLIDSHALSVVREALEFIYDTSNNLELVAKTLSSGLLHTDADIDQYLQLAINESKIFESIYLLDDNYRITHLGWAATATGNRQDYLGLDLSTTAIIRERKPGSEHFWSDTFLSPFSTEPSVTLGISLPNRTLLGTVSLKKISGVLVERLGQTDGAFQFSLIDRKGILIADSRPNVTSLALNLRRHPEVRNALDHQMEVRSKFHEDNSLLESVRSVPGIGWVAYVSLPVQEAMQGLEPLRYLLVSALTFAGCLGGILSLWLSRRMSQPILLLRDAAREVASGNYGHVIRNVSYDELENLSDSFREMVVAVGCREQELNQSRGRFQDLVNTIDGIVWELDVATFRFTFVSRQAEQILGYPVKRWLDEQDFWASHVHDEDRERVLSYCLAETQAQRDHDFEYRMLAADGQVVWLRDVVSVVSVDNRPVQLRGVMLDITKRKAAELILHETTTQLQLLINRMPFGCIMWDAEMKVKLWNPAAEKIFGFAAEGVIGKHPFDFIVPEQAKQKVSSVLERLVIGEAIAHSINENLTRDGRMITCEWHNTLLTGPDGTSEAVISIVQDITQRVAAEKALKESETRFRTVFETHPDAVLITSLVDSRIINVNDNCLKLSGYTAVEMVGKTAVGLGLWAKPGERDTYLSQMGSHGFLDNFEMALRVKDGRLRTGLASARTLMLNDELCSLVVIRDITEMKEAESRLVRSETRFRSLVSVLGEGIIILGYNGEVVQCNQAAERILKMKADDIIGKLNVDMMPAAIREDGSPYDTDQHPAVVTQNTGETVINRIMGLPDASGHTTWLQVNTHTLGLDRHGKPLAVVLSFADVTHLKLVEDELRRNEKNLQLLSQQFKGVLEAIPDQILILDRDLSIVWLNRQFDKGLAGQVESAGIPCHENPDVLCGPASGCKSPLCDKCPVKQAIASGRNTEEQMSLQDGRTLSMRVFPILDEQQKVVNIIVTMQDITEATHNQAQAMRTGQLAALGELAAGVAHEINNPINGVINYAQLILNKAAADSREEELSRRIIRESERIATIVRELLYFAREESREVSKISVSKALDEALALIRNQLVKEGIDLQVQLPEDLPEILSHSHQIQQLFLNLISNARHALTEKYPEACPDKILRVAGDLITRGEEPHVRIVFHDHGVGIAPDLLPRVLNPFVTTKASGEGTGLGLSISHEIVQKHGGTLTIDSVHGKFTEVVVLLPAAKA